MRNKKAVFFSIDAIIAIAIILLVVLTAYPVLKYTKRDTQIHYDILTALSSLKTGEINNAYVQSLISQGVINDTDKSILEQIGEFYITDIALAKSLANSALSNVHTNKNIGIWYGNTLIASINKTPIETAKNIETARRIISGIKEGESITGFSARAFLASNSRKKYFYFGGYIGDGNITTRIEYNGSIQSAEMELTINNNFKVYVNGIYAGSYNKSTDEFTPKLYSIPISSFNPGANLLELGGNNLHIGGGFIRITYKDSVLYEQPEKYFFPGIDGLINIYDGFYIPGSLNSLDISLHINANYTSFLTIGNTTVFKNSTIGEQTITIPNSKLSSLLNYPSLSRKTIPLRLGLENVSYVSNISRLKADAFSVTDLSGSMVLCNGAGFWCCMLRGGCDNQPDCQSCGGTWEDKLYLAKQANYIFIDTILNYSENRVGLVGYSTTARSQDYHELSSNNNSLKAKVNSWAVGGTTCICCGINKAVAGIQANSTIDKSRSIVIMSDGEANVRCAQQGTPNAKQDAIKAACDARAYNITVHAIGFGSGADEYTLQQIAECGNGDYYFGNVDDLTAIYNQIAQSIIEATYKEQTIETNQNLTTKLYPDSYIEFNYIKDPPKYGLIVTTEKQFSDKFSGSFTLPENSTIVETRVVSYSGPRWTNKLQINNSTIYNLSSYGTEYIQLGDPYVLNIPDSFIQKDNNIIVTTATSSSNSTEGSAYNKIIYTVVKNATAYSKISPSSEGCEWTIEFEDSTNITIPIPSSYPGTSTCQYAENSQIFNENDATQNAIYGLLRILDLNSNYKIDSKFTEEDLQIELTEITNIPYTWSTEVQARTWY